MEEKNQPQKETTLDDLALMIAKGFGNIDERFEQVDGRLDKIETRLDKVEERLDKIETRLDKVEERLGNIEADLNKKVNVIDNNTLIYRVEKLEKKFA